MLVFFLNKSIKINKKSNKNQSKSQSTFNSIEFASVFTIKLKFIFDTVFFGLCRYGDNNFKQFWRTNSSHFVALLYKSVFFKENCSKPCFMASNFYQKKCLKENPRFISIVWLGLGYRESTHSYIFLVVRIFFPEIDRVFIKCVTSTILYNFSQCNEIVIQ